MVDRERPLVVPGRRNKWREYNGRRQPRRRAGGEGFKSLGRIEAFEWHMQFTLLNGGGGTFGELC